MENTYKLTIKNYQIITDATIEFTKGVTLLTGKSNNGKSSIVKAFQQLVYNTSGTHYISHNAKTCLLQLDYNDTHVTYKKTKTDSSYDVKTPNTDQHLSKLGSSQPELIKTCLHIDKDLNYNFWNQMDKPFLISLTPKEQFNIIQQSPHSQALQQCLSSITQDTKDTSKLQLQHQSQLQLLQQQNQQFTQQLKNLPTLQTLFTTITNLKTTQQDLQQLQQTYKQYEQISLTSLQTRINQLQSLPNLTNLSDTFHTISNTQSVYQQLLKTTKPINDLHYKLNQNTQSQQQLQQILTTYFSICPLCNQPFH